MVRGLGQLDATMIVVGILIGSGIFIVSAESARLFGAPGWLLAAWALASLMTIAGAQCCAELAAMMPHAGGPYVYLREAYGPAVGFLFGWTLSVVVHTSDARVNDSAAAPEAGIAIRLLDYSFEVGDSLRSGHHTIRVENAGVEPHDLVLMKRAPGTTMADVQRWLNPERARRSDQAADPAPSPESLGTFPGGIAAIAPGMRVYFDADITAGEYVFICMATAPDGRSHIEHGMIQRFGVR